MRRRLALFSLFFVLSTFFGAALAQTQTPAGTAITNQAFATYTDSAGQSATASSNTVTTTVLPIYDFIITPDGATAATPGQQKTGVGGETVTFPYIIVNQGNAPDTIALSVQQDGGDNFDLTGVQIYLDTNGNGVVDPGETTITSLPSLAAGGQASVIVVGTLPAGTATGAIANINLQGTGTANGATPNTDTDNWARINALAQPNLTITQTANPASGSTVAPNAPITYTLNGSNAGGSSPFAVDNVVNLDGTLTDGILISEPIPEDLTYVAGSLSGSFTYPNGITATPIYSTNGGTTWTATQPAAGSVTNVGVLLPFAAGTRLNGNTPTLSYTMSFSATVPADALAGESYTATGNIQYDQNGNGAAELAPENLDSNPVTHTVAAVNTLALGPDGFPAGNGSGTYTQANPNVPADTATITRSADTQTIASVNNGRTVVFQQSLQNTGTTTDTYTLSSAPPVGLPGSVSFTDLAGNPISGSAITLASGAIQDFLVVITLPDDYVSTVPSNFTVTATSGNDTSVSNSTTDTISEIVEDDIYGVNIGSSDGSAGTAPSNTPVNVPVTPGTNTVANVPLELTNTGNNNSDTYTLSGSSTLPGTPAPVYFRDTNCDGSPDGSAITTITLAPGENVCLIAQVSVDPATPAGPYNVVSTATSTLNPGVTDTITNTVTAAVVQNFTFNADLAQSTNPGQPTIYQHTVTNNSNAPADVAFTVTEPGTTGWTYEYSLDGITYTTNLASLTPTVPTNGTQAFYVRVTPPLGATDGTLDNFTITATPTYNGVAGTADTVTDTTTVTAGTLILNKSVDKTEAAPGELVTYTITGTNTGTGVISNVQIYDTLPNVTSTVIADTEFVSVSATASFAGTVLYSTNGTTWSTAAPTTLGAGGTFYVGVNTATPNTEITAADIMPAGGVITVTFVVQVADGIAGTTPTP